MKGKDLKIIKKVIKHIKRKYPGVKIGYKKEDKWFYLLYIEQIDIYGNPEFIRKRDFVRKIHGKGISKTILFVRWSKDDTNRY